MLKLPVRYRRLDYTAVEQGQFGASAAVSKAIEKGQNNWRAGERMLLCGEVCAQAYINMIVLFVKRILCAAIKRANEVFGVPQLSQRTCCHRLLGYVSKVGGGNCAV